MNSINLTALETLVYTGPMRTLAGIASEVPFQFKNLRNLKIIMHATSQNICLLSSSSTSIQFHNLITLDLTFISPDALNKAIPPVTLEHLQVFKFLCNYPSAVTLDFINALRLPSLRSFALVLHTPGYSLNCDPSTIVRSLIVRSQCTRTIKSLTIITNLRMDVQRLFDLLRVVTALDYFQLRAENHNEAFRVELDGFLEERFPRIQKRIELRLS
ncbi:hypothetical protein ONZ45_g19314 [Pleurotus djamor]|nr:hypothetical protein ONZ45_g19314 [Pleurotus djamor]